MKTSFSASIGLTTIAVSTVNQAMYCFCFSSSLSLFALVKKSISLATAILEGSNVPKRTFLLSSRLLQSLMLSRKVSHWDLYQRLISMRSPLLRVLTRQASMIVASLLTTAQGSWLRMFLSASDCSDTSISLICQIPRQMFLKNFYLHSNLQRFNLVSYIEGRNIVLYLRQQASILLLSRRNFQVRACCRACSLLCFFYSSWDRLLVILGASLFFWRISILLFYISSLSFSSFSSCSLNILMISWRLMPLSTLLCTTCSSSTSSSSMSIFCEGSSWFMDANDCMLARELS